jgi:hypothetical protein
MKHMLIEGNRVYGNERYGIDPHIGTYNMKFEIILFMVMVIQALYVHLIVTI